MYSSLIQEEKGRKIRIPPTYGNLMYSVTLSNPSAATLISRKLLDPATSLGQQENWPDELFSFQAYYKMDDPSRHYANQNKPVIKAHVI